MMERKRPGYRQQRGQHSGATRVRNRYCDHGENSLWGAKENTEENRIDMKTIVVMKDQIDLLDV